MQIIKTESVKKTAIIIASSAICGALLTGCSTDANSKDSDVITVLADDSKCEMSKKEFPEGTTTLELENKGTKITELYVYQDKRIVTERENIGPGTKAEVVVELKPGSYQVVCKPGMVGDGIKTEIKVVAGQAVKRTPEEQKAIDDYRAYVQAEADKLPGLVTEFKAAIAAGDREKAKSLYAPSRIPWERIEPVAESFGEIDPRVDIREKDLEKGQEFTGWHRIEKALWTGEDLAPMVPVAEKLLTDVKDLASRIPNAGITPTSIANGAKELLDEVATGKVTGEEEVFSHTDLVDFKGNIEGAEKAFEVLKPIVVKNDEKLAKDLATKFAAAYRALDAYKSGDGFISYDKVTAEQRKELMRHVDALAEPLSKLGGAVDSDRKPKKD